jgi:flagellar biosynthesis/type III secretory pathway M-ring protein FliF/YscJ
MGSFWRIILVSVLIFYIFSMIIKWIFRRKMRKLQEQMEQSGQNDIQTRKDEDKNPHVDPNIGEYTDFEEIE